MIRPRTSGRLLGHGAFVGIVLSAACHAAPPPSSANPEADATTPGPAPIFQGRATAGRHHTPGVTYYVRIDGGDGGQCNGRSDARYPGSGSGKDCAWNSPGVALPPSGTPRIAGGDTLLIGAGTYRIGRRGHMQPIPSGPSAAAPTRILGKPGATPILAGINGIHRVLNLDGSSNVEIGNIEITDQNDCVFRHSHAGAACTPDMEWARVGLYARNSSNVWIHDVDIHGMAARGINAGGLRDWTLERIRLNRNGTAGWDGNVEGARPNDGRITIRDAEIGWNGCGERWKTREPWACWAQSAGGYGDGLGLTESRGQWLIEDAFVHHNTSDGLDLRYMDGADSTHVTLRRIHAAANAGNQVKVKGNSLIEQSVLVGHCSYFSGKFFMTDDDLCRADGSTLQLVMTGNDTAIVRGNTLAGEGATQIGHSEGDASDAIHIRNNMVVGFDEYPGRRSPSRFNGGRARANLSLSGNRAWNVRSCPEGTVCTQHPKLADMALASFDARPLPGSPVDKASSRAMQPPDPPRRLPPASTTTGAAPNGLGP